MEHAAAISATLIPLLLALIGVEFAVIIYQFKRSLEKNEQEHGELFARVNSHDVRLTRVETEVSYLHHAERTKD